MLDAVYVDAKKTKSIVAIKPKPPFKPVFQLAASREGSDIRIINEALKGSSLFLVETGEGRTPPETRYIVICFLRSLFPCLAYCSYVSPLFTILYLILFTGQVTRGLGVCRYCKLINGGIIYFNCTL
jgi:hypothetical protein